jgi:hypothetical protein
MDWSAQALQRAQVQRPLLPPETSSAVAALWAQCSGLGDRHESCLNLGNLASADRFAAEHERVAAQLTDPKRPASLLVHERGLSVIPPIDVELAACWLFATPQPLIEIRLAELLDPEELCEAQQLATTLADPKPQLARERSTEVRPDLKFLDRALEQGLVLRLGEQIRGPEELVLVHLIANAATCPGLRVCEACRVVFEAPRAVRCRACRKNPREVFVEAWHTAVAVGDPAAGNITRIAFARSETSIRMTRTARQRKPTMYEIRTPTGLAHVTNPRQKHVNPAARVAAHRPSQPRK